MFYSIFKEPNQMIVDPSVVTENRVHSLTKHQVQLLKSSFRQLNARSVAAKFYNKLFELHPEIKHLFVIDPAEQMDKLMSVLELVVFSFEEKSDDNFNLQESLIVPLRDLGRKHVLKGILPEHYVIANDLLLQTLEAEIGFRFTFEVRKSWGDALNCLSAAMQDSSIDVKSTASIDFSVKEKFGQIISVLKKISFHQ